MQIFHHFHVCRYFTASWCGPCKFISPTYDALSVKYADKAVFLKVDVDKARAVAGHYGVSAMPTVMIFTNSTEVSFSFLQGWSESGLRAAIARALGEAGSDAADKADCATRD